MRAVLHGKPGRAPSIAVVGTWDPLVPAHEHMFQSLSAYGKRAALTSTVIMLDPAPPSLIPETPLDWPTYDDPATRIALIRRCGVDATLLVGFKRRDLDAPPDEFFGLLERHTRIDELWLGAHQSLGRGPASADDEVVLAASKHGITVRRLPEVDPPPAVDDARTLLKSGYLRTLSEVIGRPPVWSRPHGGKLRLPWPPGVYECVPAETPYTAGDGPVLRVRLVRGEGGLATLVWPSPQIRWLSFVAGPGDHRALKRSRPARRAAPSAQPAKKRPHPRVWGPSPKRL